MLLVHVLYDIVNLHNILIFIKASVGFSKKYLLPVTASNYPIALCNFNPKMAERSLKYLTFCDQK